MLDANKVKQILVVDDEQSICEIVKAYLQKNGYYVFQALSAEKAVDIIRGNTIDLVLTDIKMPGMTGVDLLKWIKDYNSSLPVIMTTGFPTLDTAIEALKLGAYDYLTKPFHLEEVIEKISRAIHTRQLKEDNLLFSKLVSLHEVTKELSSTHILAELYNHFLNYSIKVSRSNGGSLLFFDESLQLKIVMTSPDPYNETFWQLPVFNDASHWAVDVGESMIINNMGNTVPEDVPNLPDFIQSYMVFPLKTSKKIIGILNLVRERNTVSYSKLDLELINVLASQASISIENARLYQNIRHNYLKTVRGFALAVEAKDKYTHGHSENVMNFTVILAKYLGFEGKDIEQIKYAGLLHDIGKIGVDEAILNKPGKLTPDEFEQIKRHPELGSRILENVPFFEYLVPLIKHHHEFFNGEGYPSGLAGEDIPYGARLLSVADAFEAMTSNRPYRKALSRQVAFDIMKKEMGSQFDPEIVESFLEVMKSMEKQ